MKLLQVLAGAPHGGAETAFVDMCVAYKDAGQDVRVVTRANPVRVPMLEAARIPVHALPFGGAVDVYTPYKIRQIIKDFQPDIVQTWMSRAAAHVTRWSPSMGITPYKVVSRLGGYYKIKYFKNTDYFAVITPDIGRHLVEECSVAPERVRHINNFAETEEVFEPALRDGIPEGATLCLALGRLHESKAFDVLIRSVADLDDVYLWVAGEGPDRQALENLISALSLEKRVRLLGWRSDRAALFQAADICVFPSRYEPFGTVFVQAWAQGVPVITTDSAGPKQFVRDGHDGLVVGIDDVEALRAAIKRLAGDWNLQEKLVKNGAQSYLHGFTKEKCVQAYLDYFEEILVPEMKN